MITYTISGKKTKHKAGLLSHEHVIKVDSKDDIDILHRAFDKHVTSSIAGEIVLDTASINACEDATSTAISLFGELAWKDMPIGQVLMYVKKSVIADIRP
jgi:hypothetical protein